MFSHVRVTGSSSDLKSFLDITQVIIKAYHVTKANKKNTIICTNTKYDL